jgi:putative endonuclease
VVDASADGGRPVDDRATLGRTGEDAALDQYRRRGFELVARNWRCRVGELDLVVRRGGMVVFCEVKARRGAAFGRPFDAVDLRKQRKLRSVARAFLALRPEPAAMRFDVASVTLDQSGRPQVHLFEDAF